MLKEIKSIAFRIFSVIESGSNLAHIERMSDLSDEIYQRNALSGEAKKVLYHAIDKKQAI